MSGKGHVAVRTLVAEFTVTGFGIVLTTPGCKGVFTKSIAQCQEDIIKYPQGETRLQPVALSSRLPQPFITDMIQ
ncbi:hypothetical protein HYQ46_010880 [Verticillium longisporum]|nr:hypothetical protein HYQ46_010880 [Verticillium longisporum]